MANLIKPSDSATGIVWNRRAPLNPLPLSSSCTLALVISASLSLMWSDSAGADSTPGEFNLAVLNGNDGFALDGESAGDRSGYSVSKAGDVNGDGIDDLIIGSSRFDGTSSGRAYVIFGSASPFANPLDLSSLSGSNGFQLAGEETGDLAGARVSTAGDINGDGIDDLIIGAYRADPNGSDSGRSYVVFGSASAFPNPFALSTLNGSNGFAMDGETSDDRSGSSVSAAGDVNGDGIDDLIIGAPRSDSGGDSSGRSYVVFGSTSAFSDPLSLGNLDGSNGFALTGSSSDGSGNSVSGAGDVNGDGIDDLIIGAFVADPNGSSSGRAYVVFGSDDAWPSEFVLSSLDGQNGVAINGETAGDFAAYSVSAAGDVNGDGLDDVVIGAPRADPNGQSSGRAYVVFGSAVSFSSPFNLSNLNGSNGFRLDGDSAGDRFGESVGAAGDVNGDGIDDLIIGARDDDPNGANSGRSFVVFGSTSGFPNPLDLAALDGTNGFALNGETDLDGSGKAVNAAGDLNGDGIGDLVIAAPFADPNGNASGRTYVIFGVVDTIFSDRFASE